MRWFKALIIVISTSASLCGLNFGERTLTKVQAKISPGPPLAMTGAPDEGTCIGCHYTYGGADGVPNLGPGRIQLTGLPAHYTPGQRYTVTVTLTANEASTRRWGFELTALNGNGSSETAGELVVTDALHVLKRTGSVLDKPRVYLSHNDEEGTSLGRTGANSWTFDWTAPSSAAGEVTFYAAGNAADGQVTPEGDYIYTTLAVVKPPAPIVAGQALSGLSSYLSATNATQVELRARGNFGAGAKLIFNNVELPTQTTGDGLLATLSTTQLNNKGAYPVRVRLSNGELTNALSFVVANLSNKAVAAVDAASYTLAVTPGQIAALFGSELTNNDSTASASVLPLPRTLQNTTVYVNGVAAPLFFTSNGQINFQVPYSTAIGLAAIVVQRADGTAAQGFVNVYPTAPALFTANAAGSGQAVALNEDLTPNSAARRARQGSYVVLFGTGTGAQLNNASSGQAIVLNDGEAATSNPLVVTADSPTVLIGERAANVVFSGLTPGLVSLWQVNVQISNDAPSGGRVEVLVSLGARTANRVTLAIQ